MRCSACRAENPPDSAFCVECGTPVEAACPSCGAGNPPGAKFCRRCGKPTKGLTMAVTAATRVEAPTAATAMSPTSFGNGRYRVLRFLGDGATKRVYLARDTELGRDVAFALIKTEGLDEAGIARVRRQAQAMRRLGAHPYIVTVFDVSEEEGRPCIISRYVSGGDLPSRLREAPNHRLPIAEALRIGEQICDALEHAHRRGVVHRELKPANVWLTPSGDAILGDFGLALVLDISRLTEPGSVVTSALYMPPERALGQGVDARGDLYALGVILYETVTGRPPFLGDDTISIVSQHLN
jgi:serine/threonine protein kinase/ribosomal protein L40E